MGFLPENYEAPSSASGYMKIQEGENRVRILSRPIIGWEDWHNKKPVRFRLDDRPVKSIDPVKPIKHFWAFVVWNYTEQKIQILQVTQATIRKSVEALCKDSDWGSPFNYDIKITRKGEGKETEYSVNPVPHKSVDPSIIQAFEDRKIRLEALFTGEDPFGQHEEYTTLGVAEATSIQEAPKKEIISSSQASELLELFDWCDKKYVSRIFESLARAPNPIKRIEDLPLHLYEGVKKGALENKSKHNNQQLEMAIA